MMKPNLPESAGFFALPPRTKSLVTLATERLGWRMFVPDARGRLPLGDAASVEVRFDQTTLLLDVEHDGPVARWERLSFFIPPQNGEPEALYEIQFGEDEDCAHFCFRLGDQEQIEHDPAWDDLRTPEFTAAFGQPVGTDQGGERSLASAADAASRLLALSPAS